MTWAGSGLVWTISGGVPGARLIGEAQAAATGFSFVQISDSHIGFDKPANPNALGSSRKPSTKSARCPTGPRSCFTRATSRISRPRPAEFDDAEKIIGGAKLDVHYVPGEHDVFADDGKSYLDRYGKGTSGRAGTASITRASISSASTMSRTQGGGLGSLGAEQLEWVEKDVEGLQQHADRRVRPLPLWAVSPGGMGNRGRGPGARSYLKRFGSVTVLNGHIHQIMQKVEGNVTFHTAMSTAFPQPAPGTAPAPGPKLVPAGELHGLLGVQPASQ